MAMHLFVLKTSRKPAGSVMSHELAEVMQDDFMGTQPQAVLHRHQ